MSDKKRGLPERVRMRHGSHFVEELTNRADNSIGRMVPLSAVIPDPDQPRSAMGDLSELVSSILHVGVLEPILVRPLEKTADADANASVGQVYKIISGERRFRASMEAGLSEIPVIIMDVEEDQALEIALIENLQRKDLTPFEEAEGYRMLSESHQYTHEEIAESVGKSRTVVTESLSLLQMPPRVRDTVLALGISSKSLLLEVLKAGSEGEMIELLEEVARRGLNRDDLRQRLRRDRSSGRRKPYVFRFKSPDKSYSLAMSFRQSEVDRDDLIRALENILEGLRKESSSQQSLAV